MFKNLYFFSVASLKVLYTLVFDPFRQYYQREVDDLRDAKDMRVSADYGMVFSEEGARTLIINADKFFRKAAETLES